MPDQIARWIESVVPSVHTASQSPDVTVTLVSHLKRESVTEERIATALGQTQYQWAFPVSRTFTRISVLMRLKELEGARKTSAASMPRGRVDLTTIQEKAAQIDARYDANAHDPELQRTLLRELLDLLSQVEQPVGETSHVKQRIEAVQAEILRSAPNIARLIRHVTPEGLRRMRRSHVPDRHGFPVGARSVAQLM